MFRIHLLNEISEHGLALFPGSGYMLPASLAEADAIIMRSAKLREADLPGNLKAIARAGVGVNNIPVDACTERGVAVFNTPGANANGVKELVIAALLLSSRRIYQGISWTQSLGGQSDDIVPAVEQGKAEFTGPELKGKRLGVVGLGSVGILVANDALALGMDVIGYDKYLSIEAAWGLSRDVIRAASLDQLLSGSDYITVHVPLNDTTTGMLAAREFALMRPGTRLINLARGGLVDSNALLSAIETGVVACYVTDFPSAQLIGHDRIITIPHLGASTPESEDNCAVMAVRQLRNFLEKGAVANSVNFPDCDLVTMQGERFVVAHCNIPSMIAQITTELAQEKLNITELLNQHKGGLGYTIIDVEGSPSPEAVRRIRAIEGVKQVRVIGQPDHLSA